MGTVTWESLRGWGVLSLPPLVKLPLQLNSLKHTSKDGARKKNPKGIKNKSLSREMLWRLPLLKGRMWGEAWLIGKGKLILPVVHWGFGRNIRRNGSRSVSWATSATGIFQPQPGKLSDPRSLPASHTGAEHPKSKHFKTPRLSQVYVCALRRFLLPYLQ